MWKRNLSSNLHIFYYFCFVLLLCICNGFHIIFIYGNKYSFLLYFNCILRTNQLVVTYKQSTYEKELQFSSLWLQPNMFCTPQIHINLRHICWGNFLEGPFVDSNSAGVTAPFYSCDCCLLQVNWINLDTTSSFI